MHQELQDGPSTKRRICCSRRSLTSVELSKAPIESSGSLVWIIWFHFSKDIDNWRDSLHYGLSVRFQDTNIILSGGIDDVWQDTRNGQLVVADYKSQANNKRLDPVSYLGDAYHEGYKIQMDFYGYLLSGMGFKVSAMSYFLVCNADRNANQFAGKLDFNEVLIPYQWYSEWIPKRVNEMIDLLNSDEAPKGNFSCKNCAYARQRSKFDAPRIP